MTTTKPKTNPFGQAKPREEVLASKGIDFRVVDRTVEEKAMTARHHDDNHDDADAAAGQHCGLNQRSPHPRYPEGDHNYLLTPERLTASSHKDGCLSLRYPTKQGHYATQSSFDTDDATHETASISTTHSHLTHNTTTQSYSRGAATATTDPFGNARPREEVLADKGVDVRIVDAKIERCAEGAEHHVFAGHHTDDTASSSNRSITTTNLISHNHPNEITTSTSVAREQPKPSAHTTTTSTATTKPKPAKKKIDPFGNARPREEVLAEHGVDYHQIDDKVERKVEAEHLTPEQEEQAETIRLELTEAEEAYWDANENEMPEEELRIKCDEKRKELHDLLEKFQEINLREQKEEEQQVKRQQQQQVEQEQRKHEDTSNQYHFQGHTDGGRSYRDRESSRKDEEQEEYHGGDARRYANVERPSYARRYDNRRYDNRYDNNRYDDDEICPDERRGRGGRGYYRGGGGGRGRGGGPGGRYGGGGRGRYHHGGSGRGYGRGYSGNGDRRGRYRSGYQRCDEHWSLCD